MGGLSIDRSLPPPAYYGHSILQIRVHSILFPCSLSHYGKRPLIRNRAISLLQHSTVYSLASPAHYTRFIGLSVEGEQGIDGSGERNRGACLLLQ